MSKGPNITKKYTFHHVSESFHSQLVVPKYSQLIKLQGSLINSYSTNNRSIIFNFNTEIYSIQKSNWDCCFEMLDFAHNLFIMWIRRSHIHLAVLKITQIETLRHFKFEKKITRILPNNSGIYFEWYFIRTSLPIATLIPWFG